MSEIVLDASALMALLNMEPGAEMVAEVIHEAVISTVNFSEVTARLTELGASEEVVRGNLEDFTFDIVSFDTEQAYDAGILRSTTRRLGLSLGDRCCIALARSLNLPVLTADRAWARLTLDVEVQLIR